MQLLFKKISTLLTGSCIAMIGVMIYSCSSPGNNPNEIDKQLKIDSMQEIKEVIDSVQITHRYTKLNGIKYHYAEAGKGPLVIMLHGFPELWYSWRHQLAALGKAGYHAVAPDLRGFGESEVTPNVRDYSLLQHARDVKALIDNLGAKEAVIIGHDWGANLMWIMPMLYPETVKAVVSLSIPFYPEPRDPAEIRKKWSSVFTNFEKKGVVEAEFNNDPERFFKLFFYGLSGDAPAGTINKLYVKSTPNDKLMDLFPDAAALPKWLTQKDLDYYVSAYKKTGITGALNFYRNTDEDYPLLKDIYKKGIHQPVLFIGGGEEAAVKFGSVDPMKGALPNLRKIVILPGCGHWLQQERPAEVNAAIIEFLNGLSASASVDEAAIRALENRFAAAVSAGDVDGIMMNYIPDKSLVVFDVVPRKEYLGADAYRKAWVDFFTHFNGKPKLTISDLGITVDGNLGFSHSFMHVTGTDPQGHPVDRTVRVTAGYRKVGGNWLIVHEHISVPIDLKTGKAVLSSKP